MNLAKLFNTVFWYWAVACALCYVCGSFIYFSDKKLPWQSTGEIPSWVGVVHLLGYGLILGIFSIFRFRYREQAKANESEFGLQLMIMGGILILLIVNTTILYFFSHVNDEKPQSLKCPDILPRTDLFKYKPTGDSALFAIAYSDTINVTKMSCEQYEQNKWKTRDSLLDRCDYMLVMNGYKLAGKKIRKYLSHGDTSDIVRQELINANVFLIDEQVYPVNNSYYYKATVCVAKEHAIDSLIDVAITKYCMRFTCQQKVLEPLLHSSHVTFSLSDIVRWLSVQCPDNKYVKQINKMCNGIYDCDSVYFNSARYELSEVSRIILESFFKELLKVENVKYTIDFYGYTDSHPVYSTIAYKGGGDSTRLCELLPDENKPSWRINSIRSNVALSFARAYSCYSYMLLKFPGKNIRYRYTGCGESDKQDTDPHQRTVKIAITKN